ncbi:MAG: hypothetical protein JSS81_00580 [Acidobacteria bacterium]|nr:hypothetical protein [Acidobacteriota bacterium]
MDRKLAYRAFFENDWGAAETVLERDGIEFSFAVRGVIFESGTDFDFQPRDGTDVRLLDKFILNGLSLAAFTLEFVVPVRISSPTARPEAEIAARFECGPPAGPWRVASEKIFLKLDYDGHSLVAEGLGFFEALTALEKLMPAADRLRICFFCGNASGWEAHLIENFHCGFVPDNWTIATDSCPDFKPRNGKYFYESSKTNG